MPGISPERVSIVIPCKNEKEYITRTLRTMLASKYGDIPEIIVVDDGSTDGCCEHLEKLHKNIKVLATPGVGVSYARNLGAKAAKGDLLFFCDANIVPESDWIEQLLLAFADQRIIVQAPYLSDIANPHSGGYGMTLNSRLEGVWLGLVESLTPVPVLPSTCLAIYKDAYFNVGGFDEGFRVLGHEDVELSIRLWLCGYELFINPFTRIKHVFRAAKPYYFEREHWVYNVFRLGCLHFDKMRIAKTLDLFAGHAYFTKLVSETMLSDVWQVRERLLSMRKYDDGWYMSKFSIPF